MRSILAPSLIAAALSAASPAAANDCDESLPISDWRTIDDGLPPKLEALIRELLGDAITFDKNVSAVPKQPGDPGPTVKFLSSAVLKKSWFVSVKAHPYEYPHTLGFKRQRTGDFYFLPAYQFVGPPCKVLEAVNNRVGTDSLVLSIGRSRKER